VKNSKNEATAKAFITMLKADEGMNILNKYGFENAQ
jgi:ABC-type molybdate transport system substrate-binding protein